MGVLLNIRYRMQVGIYNNLSGLELDNNGVLDGAIELYEANVSIGFVGSHPYDRLATIYHKQQNYTEEIRVIEAYFSSFSPNQLRACSVSLRVRPACIFSVIFRKIVLQYDSMAAAISLHLTKNLAAQYAHAEILNRLLKEN